MHRLSARDLRRSRPFLLAVRAVWTLVAAAVGIAAVATSSEATYERPAIWSGDYVSFGLWTTVALGAIGVWYAPRATLATAVGAALLGGSVAPTHGELWWPVGLLAAALLALVVVRDRRSVPRGSHVLPSTGVSWADSWASPGSSRPKLGLLAIGLVAVAALAGLVLHQVRVAAVAAFESEATWSTAPIVRVDEFESYVYIEVDGVEHEIADLWSVDEYQVGDRLTILVAPDGEVSLAGPGQGNPAWILGVIASLPMLGAFVWQRMVAPARRRERLVTAGGPSTTVRVVCNGDVALVLPVDGDWPALELHDLAGHVPGEAVQEAMDHPDWDAEDEPDDHAEESEPQLPSGAAELASWADGIREEVEREETEADVMTAEEKRIAEAVVGPDTNGAEPFLLVGSWASGGSVALARETGQVWFAEVSEPTPFKGRRRFVRSVHPERPGWDSEPEPATPVELFTLWALRNARWTRWVAALATAAVAALLVPALWIDDTASWLAADAWIDAIMYAVATLVWGVAPLGAISWSLFGFSRARAGFASFGFFFDDVVARDRVELISAGETAVGVRLRGPDDVMGVDPEVVREGSTPAQAAAELQRWIDQAPRNARSGRRPSPGLVAVALMLVAWGVQFALVLV